jgi:uncharacterized protein (TIGR00730 family)
VPIKTVCIYCGSASRIAEKYVAGVRDVGALMAERGIQIIYGGVRSGLMGMLADSALAAGGKVTGIIPTSVREHELQHKGLSELIVVDTLHTRKQMMFDRSEAIVILPGGLGTLDEAFEVMTWKQLGLHNKHVIIYNMHGFWQPLFGMLDHIIAHNFAPISNKNLYTVANNLSELLLALESPRDAYLDPSGKWQ